MNVALLSIKLQVNHEGTQQIEKEKTKKNKKKEIKNDDRMERV